MKLFRSILAALVWSAMASAVTAQPQSEPAKPAPEETTGIKIGQKAPAFKLKDQNGAEVSLEELLKKGKIAVIFYRSADW